MNKLILAFCLTLAAGTAAFAQTAAAEPSKNEYYVGFSNQQVQGADGRNFNGFEAAYVRRVSRYFGVKGDFSAAYRNSTSQSEFQAVPGGPITSLRSKTNSSLYNVLGGIQIKDSASTSRFRPFAHALAGVAHSRYKFDTNLNTNNFGGTFSETGFSAVIGGGLDIKINNRFDFRAFQVDYNPTRLGGGTQNNVRFGIGLVIK
jgi:opacity protein-like surface antigen